MVSVMKPSPRVERALRLGMQHRLARLDNEETGMNDYEAVAKEYKQVHSDLKNVGTQLKDFVESARSEHNKLSARLQDIEQRTARRGDDADLGRSGSADVAGAVLQSLEDDASWQDAVNAAQRNMKLSAFAARANVDIGLRQALVGGGSGGSTGFPSAPERGGIAGPVARPLRLLDALPSRRVNNDAVEFVRLAALGEAAEQEAEGDEKAEIAASTELVRVEIATVAGWLAASKQVLADHAALGQMIDRVLRDKVLDRLEARIVAGYGGISGRIDGLLSQATVFTPTFSTPIADRVGDAITQMIAQGYRPSLVVMHPTAWFALSITRSLPDGSYLYGSPVQVLQPVLWNVPVVLTPSVGLNTGLVLDTSFVTVLDREQLSVTVSNSHADYFTRNLVAILAELRAGLEVLDRGAVVSVDLNVVESST